MAERNRKEDEILEREIENYERYDNIMFSVQLDLVLFRTSEDSSSVCL